MKTNKTSKRALLTSVLSIALCLSMLIGTTFAWFTDTASTAVNKIQAGTLKVGLYKDAGCTETAEGQTLKFKTADNREEILWEPGCTYQLEDVYIKNEGNLALDYTVVITGIGGDTGLNKVIDWTMKVGDSDLTADKAQLVPDASAKLSISGHMQETAGNEYQNLTLDGIAITVYATQANAENDSFGPDYDKDADMTPDNLDDLIVANVTAPVAKDSEGHKANTTVATADQKVTVAVPAAAIDDNAKELTLTVTPSTTPKVSVTSDKGVQAYNIDLVDNTGAKVTATAENPITVKLYVGKGLENVKLYHDGTEIAYTSYVDGYITFNTTSFSPFDVVYDAPAMTVDGAAYYDLTAAVTAAKKGGTITFLKSTTEPMKLTLATPLTVQNVTFKAASGVTIKGLQLASANAKTRLTLDGIKFEGISFTDKVVVGQDTSSYGLSQCTDITFDGCKFDLATSTEKYPDAIRRMGGTVSGTISEKEAVAYMDGFTVKNCEFVNVRYGIFGGKARNVTVENNSFTNCSSYAVRFDDVAGFVNIIGNTANSTGGVLSINTVGNNYSTTDIQTDVAIKDNTATGMTCGNGNVFMTAYDNARKSGKSNYTITGNTCSYTQTFDEPLNGFRIKSTYGPSVAEFIENN